jgi:hypothetical protein
MAASHPAAATPAAASQATILSFSGPLADAVAGPLPPLDGLHEGELGDLLPARFLLGVSETGEVRYVFVQDSLIGPVFGSGDKTLDADASNILERVRFRPTAAAGITWGFATFYWGSGVYARSAPTP